MKIHGINKHLYQMPDDGDGSGGGGSPPPPPPAPAGDDDMVSKKETDKQAAQQRRKHDRAQKEMQKKLDDQQAELDRLKARPPAPPIPPAGGTPPTPPVPPAAGGDPNAGKLEIMEQRFNRQLQEQQTQIDAANQTATDEREKRLQLERAQLIDKALGEAGVIQKHMVQARRFFDPQVVWDKLEECWMFQTASGNIVSISEGIAFELPDNLKTTRMRGGAGTTGGMPTKQKVAQNLLDQAKKKMTDLQVRMKKDGPKNNLLAQFTRAKNEVNRLESELAVRS